MTDSGMGPSQKCKRCGALAHPSRIVYCEPCFKRLAKLLIDECYQAGARHAEAEKRWKEFLDETGS